MYMSPSVLGNGKRKEESARRKKRERKEEETNDWTRFEIKISLSVSTLCWKIKIPWG